MKKYLIGLLAIPSFLIGMSLSPVKAEPELQDATTQTGIINTILEHNNHQDQVLDNHEARLNNNERDISELQDNTNTSPSTQRVEVPVVVERNDPDPEPLPEPEPHPITVISYRQVPLEGSENIDCEYKYSDNTTYQWHWLTVEYNQGTKTIRKYGTCDTSVVGREKVS